MSVVKIKLLNTGGWDFLKPAVGKVVDAKLYEEGLYAVEGTELQAAGCTLPEEDNGEDFPFFSGTECEVMDA